MKRSPKWQRIEERMQPGRLTRDGMLGADVRSLPEILDDDENAVSRLGVTHADIGRRLGELTAAARKWLGDPVTLEGTFEVRVVEARGSLPCPFGHAGQSLKIVTFLKYLPTGEELAWTNLNIHMIEAHGFYEGQGSPFRLDPQRVVRLLRIRPADSCPI